MLPLVAMLIGQRQHEEKLNMNFIKVNNLDLLELRNTQSEI